MRRYVTTRAIFHPEMLDRLGDFFPSVCTIQEMTETQDATTGEISWTWGDVVGLVDLPCALGATSGQEVKMPDQTYVVANYTLALNDSYTTIVEKMQAVVDSVAYEILLVQQASHSNKTRLLLRKVT